MSKDAPLITVTDASAPDGHVTVSMPGQPDIVALNEPKIVADAIHEQNARHQRG